MFTNYAYVGEEPVKLSDEPEWMQLLLQPYLIETKPLTIFRYVHLLKTKVHIVRSYILKV